MHSTLDLLDKLDSQWQLGSRADLSALLEMVPTDHRREMCVEICAADLEWRWRTSAARHQLNQTFEGEHLSNRPRSVEYIRYLGGLWDDPDCRRRILEAEWSVRSVWGDSPDVDSFATQLPDRVDWHLELEHLLDGIAPLIISVDRNPEPLVCRIPSRFVLGRQNSDEPSPPAWIASSNRMIVKEIEYRNLSREQIRFRRTRAQEIELSNISANVGVLLHCGTLLPGQRERVATPITIAIDQCEIEIAIESKYY